MSDTITLELLHPDARAPERATEDSAGYDLFVHLTHRTVSCSDSSGTWELPTFRDREKNLSYFELPPNATAMIPLGFKAKLPSGCEAQIRPRSGTTFKKGLLIPNSPGTIDADYPEEWMVLVRNPGTKPVRIEHGERIAQMVLSRYEVIPIEMGKVGKTSSRSGGFGSTGLLVLFALLLVGGCARGVTRTAPPGRDAPVAQPSAPRQDYLAFVESEAVDRIQLVRYGPAGARVDRATTTGFMGADLDGPHGVMIAPDGKHWYTTTAHGKPFGFLWKYTTTADSLVGRVMLGSFPATGQLTPDGALAFVVNFNLHGEMVPSSVSVVATDEMVEVARIQTCTMPHGSRISPDGTKQYSACMMDDMLVEIDTRSLAVARHFMLGKGREHGMSGAPGQHGGAHNMNAVTCSPTWAQPSSTGASVFVACNKSDEIVEVDVASWRVLRRIPSGPGVYNLAVTRDGKLLIATNKRGQSVSVFDVASGRELGRIPTKRRVVHGVTVTSDNRYAFITVEGIGSEPGTVEVIDLAALQTVATVDVGPMAGGIDFWRMEPAR
jgi:deoxyuridine 5'-triphosphate nucleotidohydrolase